METLLNPSEMQEHYNASKEATVNIIHEYGFNEDCAFIDLDELVQARGAAFFAFKAGESQMIVKYVGMDMNQPLFNIHVA